MKLSVIIPALNEAKHIARLIAHLQRNADDRLLEIIVADGGSTDDTAGIAEKAGVHVLRLPMQNRAAQQNAGAAAAKGSVLYFVHADVLPPASYLSSIAAALQKGFETGGCRQKFESKSFMLRINAWFTRFNLPFMRGGDQTLFITANAFQQLGGFDEKYVIMEEYDLMRRAREQYSFALLQCATVTSARKYEKNSWVRVQLANARAVYQFKRGVDPCQIRDTYKKSLNW
ncbi:MAG: TIGR04283 family arsenosugar biosynthesis glycosyltransferase [Bacteroidia bacterium]